jgi:hypothetical protein
MMTRLLSITALMLFSGLCLLPSSLQAQDRQMGAKNLYMSYTPTSRRGKPGVRVSIRLSRDGTIRDVPVSYTFRSGDKVKFLFQSNFAAYVRILNLGSRGDLQTLYPYPGAPENVSLLRNYEIPRDGWFEFDDVAGTEQLAFLFSRRPILESVESHQSVQSTIAVTGGGNSRPSAPQTSTGSDQDQAYQALNARAIDQGLENAKNLTFVSDSLPGEVYAYGLIAADLVDQIFTLKVSLKHK